MLVGERFSADNELQLNQDNGWIDFVVKLKFTCSGRRDERRGSRLSHLLEFTCPMFMEQSRDCAELWPIDWSAGRPGSVWTPHDQSGPHLPTKSDLYLCSNLSPAYGLSGRTLLVFRYQPIRASPALADERPASCSPGHSCLFERRLFRRKHHRDLPMSRALHHDNQSCCLLRD